MSRSHCRVVLRGPRLDDGTVAGQRDTAVCWHPVRGLGYARAFALASLGRMFTAEEAGTTA